MTTVPDVLDRHPDKSVNPAPYSPVRLIARKEAAEIVTSPRGLAWLLVLTGTLSGFSLLFVANTELSLLDNAQVVYDMLGVVTALGALLAVIAGRTPSPASASGARSCRCCSPRSRAGRSCWASSVGRWRPGSPCWCSHCPTFGRSAAPARTSSPARSC